MARNADRAVVDCTTAEDLHRAMWAGRVARILAGRYRIDASGDEASEIIVTGTSELVMTARGTSRVKIETRDNGRLRLNVMQNSHPVVEMRDASRARIIVMDRSRAKVMAMDSARLLAAIRGSSEPRIVALGESCIFIAIHDHSAPRLEARESSVGRVVVTDESQPHITVMDNCCHNFDIRRNSQPLLEFRACVGRDGTRNGSAVVVSRGNSKPLIELLKRSLVRVTTRDFSEAKVAVRDDSPLWLAQLDSSNPHIDLHGPSKQRLVVSSDLMTMTA